jgi:hypothetical protein
LSCIFLGLHTDTHFEFWLHVALLGQSASVEHISSKIGHHSLSFSPGILGHLSEISFIPSLSVSISELSSFHEFSDSFTIIVMYSVFIFPFESVTVIVTVYAPCSIKVCEVVFHTHEMPSQKSHKYVYGPVFQIVSTSNVEIRGPSPCVGSAETEILKLLLIVPITTTVV